MRELVRLDVSGPVATVTLARPEKRNALTGPMVKSLRSVMDELVAQDGLRVVVVDHQGPIFCAGWDVVEPRDGLHEARELARVIETMVTAPLPFVARLEGGAMGAGLALVAACDVAVSVEASVFAFSEVRVGVVPALVSLPVLRRTSPGAVAELMLTGRRFAADEAARIGLVTRMVADGGIDAAVEQVVADLLEAAPGAVGRTKRLLLGMSESQVRDELDRLAEQSASGFSSPEAIEGLRAFADRRAPSWSDPGAAG